MPTLAISNSVTIDLAGLAGSPALARKAQPHIATIGCVQNFGEKETLFSEGDPASDVYQVIAGTLRVYKALPDGRRQITGFLFAGDVLGLTINDEYQYTVEAVTEATLRRYPRSWFERLVDEVPGLARRLLAAARDELRAAQDQMLLLGRKTAEERIASFLLMLSDRQIGRACPAHLAVSMSRSDIADFLGLTTETVSRMFARMKQDGVIALRSPVRIELRDRSRLENLAGRSATLH